MTIGEFIKAKRKAKGITVRELAKRANMSHAYLSQLENGRNNNPSPTVINSLTNALTISKTEMFAVLGIEIIEKPIEIKDLINGSLITNNGVEITHEQKQKILQLLDVILN